MRVLLIYLLCFVIHASSSQKWARIKLPSVLWTSLPRLHDGLRYLDCGNFDRKTDYRYHWRFNGSSVLPIQTQIHKHQLSFLTGANADRLSLHGTYECCVHEVLGNACYSQFVNITDRPKQTGIDLTESDVLNAREGDTYYIRLFQEKKRIDAVHCIIIPDMDNVPSNVKYPIFHSSTSKQANAYHVRIEKFTLENEHVYECSIRFNKKEIKTRKFTAKLLDSAGTPTDASSLQFSSFFMLLLIGAFMWIHQELH